MLDARLHAGHRGLHTLALHPGAHVGGGMLERGDGGAHVHQQRLVAAALAEVLGNGLGNALALLQQQPGGALQAVAALLKRRRPLGNLMGAHGPQDRVQSGGVGADIHLGQPLGRRGGRRETPCGTMVLAMEERLRPLPGPGERTRRETKSNYLALTTQG